MTINANYATSQNDKFTNAFERNLKHHLSISSPSFSLSISLVLSLHQPKFTNAFEPQLLEAHLCY